MKKTAFTMLELIMVIVVLGILAALALPRLERDSRQEAADSVLSAIRYTQHLALMDDKSRPQTDSNLTQANWQRGLWHIRFERCTNNTNCFYVVSASRDGDGNVDKNEVAVDPSNGKYMDNLNTDNVIDTDESPQVFLGNKYGVNNADFSACLGKVGSAQSNNTAKHIAFDYLGRPHKGIYSDRNDYSALMHADCTIVFSFIDSSIDPFSIRILSETGYARIVDQNAS